jgi:hypothetical protein
MVAAAVDGGGGEFQGIDPAQLATLMGSMKKGVGAAQPVAGSYSGRFSRLGLGTSAVNRLLADLSWAQSQQPMLQRRHSLASHQPSAQWVNGMATNGAGDLEYTTDGQAQTAGGNAAKDFKDGKITSAEFLAQLEAHEDDPDWQTGAMKTLGEEGLWQLSREMPPTADGKPDQAAMTALAMAVATAMGNGVKFPLDDDGDGEDHEDLDLLAPLLQYADFPSDVLAHLGYEAMAPGYAHDAPMVWKALAKDPTASAMFIKQNAPEIMEWIHAGDHGGGLLDSQVTAFAAVLKAGTVGVKGTDPKLGGQAVTALLKANNADKDKHVPGEIEAVYGNIVQAYWPDVMFALTSKASASDPKGLLTSPDGMKLSSAEWAPFIDEAMRDPKTGASLLNLAHAQAKTWQDLGSQQAGGPNAGDAYNFDAGVVSGFFDYQAKTVYSQLKEEGKDAGAWKEKASEYVGEGVGLAVDIVADPGEGIAKPIAKKVAEVAITEAANLGIGAIPDGGDPPPAPHYGQWQGSWEQGARDDFNNSNPQNLKDNPMRQSLIDSAKGQPFVVNGQIPDPSTMNQQQLTAYNAWLSKPDVANYLLNEGGEAARQDGYNTTVTQESFGGG